MCVCVCAQNQLFEKKIKKKEEERTTDTVLIQILFFLLITRKQRKYVHLNTHDFVLERCTNSFNRCTWSHAHTDKRERKYRQREKKRFFCLRIVLKLKEMKKNFSCKHICELIVGFLFDPATWISTDDVFSYFVIDKNCKWKWQCRQPP